MDSQKRKELANAYKNREVIGGIYCVECSGNKRRWLKSTRDMQGSKNRFMQAVKLKTCPEPSMMREFGQFGIESFSFTSLEELKKKETQTSEEFAADIKALYELWLEKEG